MELTYYPIPGRGESVRLLLAIAGRDFKDTFVSSDEWGAGGRKQSTRWRMMPTLMLTDGRVAGQSQALLRYLGKSAAVDGTPLTPTDDVEVLLVDEVLSFVGEDIWRVLLGVRNDEAGAAEVMAPEGKAAAYLDELEANIEGTDSVLSSGSLSIADVYIFAAFGWWASGFMTKAVSTASLLSGRPKLQAIIDRVGALPAVRAYYSRTDKKKQPLAHVYGQFAKL
jgi:glutathione S-transferase|eukprot:SAG25_NODE_22_length_22323_cov_52.926874_8_plen_224_part_00